MLNEIRDIITNNDCFVVTSHINPDGDAVGSAVGLALALRATGKQAAVVLGGFPEKFLRLPGMDAIYGSFEDAPAGDLPVLICVDCATKERLFAFEKFRLTVNIDHHVSNTDYADVNYIDGEAASASEVVFRLLDGFLPISKDVADVLMLGLLSDTGGLSHSNTTAFTLRNAARLIEFGADMAWLKKRVLNYRTLPEAKIFGLALGNMKTLHKNGITVSFLEKRDFETAGAAYSDTDGISEYMLEVEGAAVSLLFTERDEGVKINFRSMSVNVSAIAAKYGGGGHKNAAGAKVSGNIFEVMDDVVEKVAAVVLPYSGNAG